MDNVGIIGAGSLGTALAQIVAQNADNVFLFLRREELANTINTTGINNEYYPNVKLEKNIIATVDYNDLKGCKIIFLSIPSSAFRTTLSNDEYVSLSGPNFASEMVLNLATVSNIASKNKENAMKVKEVLSTPQFKVKILDDVIGLEICGVIKNINAIANGICEGMNINENARYAVLTKGFEETRKIIESVGGNPSTSGEYCGFGDLVLTSTSSESRNHTLGMLYGQRIIVDEKASGIVFEGKNSIMAIKDICKKTNTKSVIVDFVYDIIVNQIPPKIAFKDLWENIEN